MVGQVLHHAAALRSQTGCTLTLATVAATTRRILLGFMLPCPPAIPAAVHDGDSGHAFSPVNPHDLEDDDTAADPSKLAKQRRTLDRMKARPRASLRSRNLRCPGPFNRVLSWLAIG